MEGSIVNLDVTAPGAILALGLMYMKTNDKNVADRLAIPDTHFALDYVRPDFILLRLVARSLVMWDSIEPTEDFILGSLPAILRDFDPSLPRDGPVDRETGHDLEALAQGQVQGLAGACMSVGLKFAGSANPNAEAILTAYVKRFLQRKREVPQTATPATSASADYRTKTENMVSRLLWTRRRHAGAQHEDIEASGVVALPTARSGALAANRRLVPVTLIRFRSI